MNADRLLRCFSLGWRAPISATGAWRREASEFRSRVDIRDKGNEANHQILLMTQQDAEELIDFVEMLIKFIYEFPNRVPKKPAGIPATTP